MRDLDVLTIYASLHHLPTGIFRTIRRINKRMRLQRNSVEISRSYFQGRQIMELKFRRRRIAMLSPVTRKRSGGRRTAFASLTNNRRVRLRPRSNYLALLLLVRIAITATPKPSRINNG